MASIIRFSVFGTLLDQSCDNEMWYISRSSSTDELAMVNDLAATWRAIVLPQISNQYSVREYQVDRLGSVVALDPTAVKLRGAFRWAGRAAIDGGSSDVGAQSGNPFPSYVSCGFIKACGLWLMPDLNTPLLGQKIPRGRLAIGGMVEGDTDGGSDANKWTAAANNKWRVIKLGLVNVVTGGGGAAYDMCLVAHTLNNQLLMNNLVVPAVPTYAVAPVNGLVVKLKPTTQNSRKESGVGA